MHARFELAKSKLPTRHRFYFRLLASNGEVIALSEMYRHRDGAIAGIQAVRDAVVDADVIDTTQE